MATITSPRAVSPNPSRITSPPPQSGIDTPTTSSVRTSLDIQSVTGSSSNVSTPTVTGSVAAPNQRRNRAALRDYYNIKAKAATSSSPGRRLSNDSTSTLASSNVTLANDSGRGLLPQLDDPTFDADGYVDELLKNSTLRDILRTEGTLVSEIKNYDGERKALVYDNYSKLIKAVGTIGEMQKGMTARGSGGNVSAGQGIDGVKALDGKLDKLVSVVKEIQGEKSQSDMSRTAGRKRGRTQKRKQELVAWVIGAPDRLGKLVTEGKRQEADAEWAEIRGILEQWKGVQGVQDVKAACETFMNVAEESEASESGDSD